jgi:hypothetical protein
MFYVDGSLNSTGTMNPTGTVTVFGIRDGSYNFYATLIDSLGNVSINSSIRTIRVDTSTPKTPTLLMNLPRAPYINSTSLLITVSGDANTIFRIYRNNILSISGTIPSTGRSLASFTGLTNESHTFRANLTNTAGTVGPDCSNILVIVDTIAPNAPILSSTTPQIINISSINITLSGEANTTYTLYVNGTFRIITGTMNPNATVIVSGLTEGQYTFNARLTDAAGNISALSSSITFSIDTSRPRAPIVQWIT